MAPAGSTILLRCESPEDRGATRFGPASLGAVRFRVRSRQILHTIYSIRMSGTTTVRVSRVTIAELERFQRALQTATVDETIRAVLRLQRAAVIGRLSGSLRGRVTRFREADRLDSDR